MSAIRDLPEVAGLDASWGTIRIPPDLDVPFTPRVRALVDTPAFQRLARVSQLGLVSKVFPAATHSRFEHSLGVFRLAVFFLRRLSHVEEFAECIGPQDGLRFLAAALLHDVGHWPFCHPIEDLGLSEIAEHEDYAAEFLLSEPVAEVLEKQWEVEPQSVYDLLAKKPTDRVSRILSSLLSGPIDVDKMDYLARDSLHAGVPYGRHFDQNRLIGSLCLNESGDGLAITDKGKTAAELMVFARYVMFSEIYWHHSVRSATAMLQRAFYGFYKSLNLEQFFLLTDGPFIERFCEAAAGTPVEELAAGLFGSNRQLYKRVAQYSLFENESVYQRLARRPYPWQVQCATHLAEIVASRLGKSVAAEEILLDAPPANLEVQFRVQVRSSSDGQYRWLEEISPVVETLARRQFDDFVKRVRILAHPRIAASLKERNDLTDLIHEAIDQTDAAD